MKELLEDATLLVCYVASWVLPVLAIAATAMVWVAAFHQTPLEVGVARYQVLQTGHSLAGDTVWLTTLLLGVPGAVGLYFRLGGRP